MKHKTLATWLAFLLGSLGVHWFYLGRKRAWLYIALFPLSFFGGCFDAIKIGLMPAEAFNRAYNPGYPDNTPQGSGLTVFAIALALAVGMGSLMAALAIVFQWYFVGVAA